MTELRGNRVRQIASNGVTTLLAGDPSADFGASGAAEGIGAAARFNEPFGIAVRPNAQVLVTDAHNHRIRQFKTNAATSTFLSYR